MTEVNRKIEIEQKMRELAHALRKYNTGQEVALEYMDTLQDLSYRIQAVEETRQRKAGDGYVVIAVATSNIHRTISHVPGHIVIVRGVYSTYKAADYEREAQGRNPYWCYSVAKYSDIAGVAHVDYNEEGR